MGNLRGFVIGIFMASSVALIWSLFLGLPKPKKAALKTGVPVVDAKTQPALVGIFAWDEPNLPPGQVTRMEIHPDGNWVMGNMLSAWWGTWNEVTPIKYEFVCMVGPAGKLKKPDRFEVHLVGRDKLNIVSGLNSSSFFRTKEVRYRYPTLPELEAEENRSKK